MSNNFKETVLRALSATDYSVDNLTKEQISSFENLPHLKPLFEWLSHSLSEANCIKPEELEEFKKLQEKGCVKHGDELDEALQSHLNKDGGSLVPFKESLNDADQELALLKEQLHYRQALHEELCSSNALVVEEIREIKKKQQKAETRQKEVIKDICATNKTLKDNIAGAQKNINELEDDIIGLAHNAGSPEVSLDEGIHSLGSEINLNKSHSTSICSFSTASSWQTIKGKASNIKYMSQLSFEKYQRLHKLFLKRFSKLLDVLAKAERNSNEKSSDYMDLRLVRERLEKQMLVLIEKEAELEGIRTARAKVKELHKTVQTKKDLILALEREKKEVEDRIEEESLNLTDTEELSTACKQWAECKALRAMEHKIMERMGFSKWLIEKMDEVLNPVKLKLNADKILLEVLRYEKERIEMSISLNKSFHDSLQSQFDEMTKRIATMQNNLEDFEQFSSLPVADRNDLVKQLTSIVLSDNKGVVQAIQHLTESSRREHQTMYEHYAQEKNKLVLSGKDMEETYNLAISQCNKNGTDSSEVIDNIQRDLDQMDSGIEELIIYVQEVINSITKERKEHKEESFDET